MQTVRSCNGPQGDMDDHRSGQTSIPSASKRVSTIFFPLLHAVGYPPARTMDVAAFVAKWSASNASELPNKDLFLTELCDVLGVPRPDPATNDPERDLYIFEKPIPIAKEGGKVTKKRADLYKAGCFLLEAKQAATEGAKKSGKVQRGTDSWDLAMVDARGQALGYAMALDAPPPFLIVCDIGYAFELYADFDGTHRWPAFPNAQKRRIYLKDLDKHVDVLRAIWNDPYSLDPSRRAEKVTREVAAQLAELAKQLEAEKNPPEAVAKFLMRCLFTMFAEHVGLLPTRLFIEGLENHWLPNPPSFPGAIEGLWRAMNEGTSFSYWPKLLRFNGGLFKEPNALKLSKTALALLLEAAKRDWSEVDPAIFGTLLERALNPKERHKLGAHYTPRAYVERLVRPTIEEPIREEWENVQTAARKLYQDGKAKAAVEAVKVFHTKLANTRVLDPACGSGNFLYVTLDLFKRIESEVLSLLHDLGERQELLHAEGIRVTPRQFLGIEIKPWAKEIAELVLWIGYLQWHFRTHGRVITPPEPVLQDYKNIECRDAVLAYDREELVRDEKGKPVTRWDGETMKKHPVTGEMVPDEKATITIHQYINPRKAEWPEADFIVGNPPYLGARTIRAALGEGYLAALRQVFTNVPDHSDFVMYWWDLAAEKCTRGAIERFGFITTKSIGQEFSRKVVMRHFAESQTFGFRFAIPNHPWVDSSDGADVRVAMTVCDNSGSPGTLWTVVAERSAADGWVNVELVSKQGTIGADLRVGVALLGTVPLRANAGLSSVGYQLTGSGFVVSADEAKLLDANFGTPNSIIWPLLSGRDLTQHPRERYAIDVCLFSENQVRRQFAKVFQRLLTRVKPERDPNHRKSVRERWWVYGEARTTFRPALKAAKCVLATSLTAKHRFFGPIDRRTICDSTTVMFALDDWFHAGVMFSRAHVAWAIAAGGRLGVGDDPRYLKATCFDTFPFPTGNEKQRKRIASLALSLDAHRTKQLAANPELTMTAMYNVLEKIRNGDALTDKERVIHQDGLVSVLQELHNDLDAAVFEAYGWPADITDEQILEKLVALNAERAAEEARGLIRWLRPEFQNPQGAQSATQTAISTIDDTLADAGEPVVVSEAKTWPKKLPEQIAAIRDRLGVMRGLFTVDAMAAGFKGAKKKDLADLLDGLAALGVVVVVEDENGRRWRNARRIVDA